MWKRGILGIVGGIIAGFIPMLMFIGRGEIFQAIIYGLLAFLIGWGLIHLLIIGINWFREHR